MTKHTVTTRRMTMGGRVLLGLWLCLLAMGAPAELPVPQLTGRVVDQTGTLTPANVARVDRAIRDLEAATNGQMAVLLIPTLNGEALEAYSLRVANTWALGDATRDDGLLLLIVVNDRLSRLEVGDGLTGKINDAQAAALLAGLTPHFRQGRFADGICELVAAASGRISGVAQPQRAPAQQQGGPSTRNGDAPFSPYPPMQHPMEQPYNPPVQQPTPSPFSSLVPFVMIILLILVFVVLIKYGVLEDAGAYTSHGHCDDDDNWLTPSRPHRHRSSGRSSLFSSFGSSSSSFGSSFGSSSSSSRSSFSGGGGSFSGGSSHRSGGGGGFSGGGASGRW